MLMRKTFPATSWILAAAIVGSPAVSAADVGQTFEGAVVVASGKAGESLICSLLYVPAVVKALDRVRVRETGAVDDASDRYANLEISYSVFDAGELDLPYVLGPLWNGRSKPPVSQIIVPYVPATPDGSQTFVLILDSLNKLAGPDFNLVCDVFSVGSVVPRRIPRVAKFDDIILKRGVVPNSNTVPRDRVLINYAYFHNAIVDTQIDIKLIYRTKRTLAGADDNLPDCPAVEADVAVVDASTLTPYPGEAFTTTLTPGQTVGHSLAISHEHQPPSGSPLVPMLVAMRYVTNTALTPHCQILGEVTAASGGVTRHLDLTATRKDVER